ncbi:hypothetical protein PCANC_14426 [Puccinia coronata f. sp. avenae]|uniref:HAT C-terminal dimerisation domain-containing protein n=1 Tax=Puccinia coronata f. sp. avenae TaxID=200324 RepID=A0A2N5SHF0_9BASI|nr:hypothetical protein PCANC_14426 [Puccinia coronata f. sp. avenae]
MTTEVDCLVCKKTGTNMNLKSNHIRCFCHKLALILNAGLKAIDVGTEGLTKDKQGTLGFVPKLALIAKEPNGKESLQTAASVHDIASDEEDGELPDHSSDESAAESVVNEDPPPALEPDVWSCSTISKAKTVDFFPDAEVAPPEDELAAYLSGKYKLPTDQAKNCLKWWKDHHTEFPILASMAKDYLACSATSASVE